jgi:rhamnopyranosyl-N-acetylglucosaminyl-diphospho-decaprenol beta-1,3/1,4-galactofuranosyltransferase
VVIDRLIAWIINESMKEKIAAVVVTYNRKDLLRKCLVGCLSQSRPLDTIIIVNNASEDGTEEMLEKEFLINPIFDYVNSGDNLGGAGGFHLGMKRAYDKGYDWLWLMDDDVIPIDNGIEKYLKYSDKFLFIQGSRVSQDGERYSWAQNFDYKTGKSEIIDENTEFNNNPWIEVNTACFEGAFINRKVISKIGLPEIKFFIRGDDTHYGAIVSKEFQIVYIKDITLTRLIEQPARIVFGIKMSIASPFSIYYTVRNNFLLEKYIKMAFPNESISHSKTIIKNLIYIFIKIILFEKHKLNLIKSFIRGLVDWKRINLSTL